MIKRQCNSGRYTAFARKTNNDKQQQQQQQLLPWLSRHFSAMLARNNWTK